MGQLLHLPLTATACTRLTQRQAAANRRAEYADVLRIARQVLRSADTYEDQIVRDACSVLETYGNGMDYLMADEAIHELNIRQRQRAAKAAMEAARTARAEEAPVRIAMRHRPQLLAVGTGWALAGLVAVAFGWWVL